MADGAEPQKHAHTPLDAKGVGFAFAAYVLWGVFPFYFALVRQAGPVEVVAHRVVWSFVFCAVGIAVWPGQWAQLKETVRNPRLLWGLAGAGVLVTVNWLVYVWGVLNDHIVDAALGYFINPLVTVALAVIVLRERLRATQIAAVGIGLLAVVVIAVGYGQVPWVALALAFSFAGYGLVKKLVGGKVSPLVGLSVETAALSPFAAGFLVWLQLTGASTFLGHGTVQTVGLLCAGVVTAIPLLLFAGASSRIPLSMMGLFQYLTPLLQFSIGVWINHEVMPLPRWIGFGLVWVALIVLTADSLRAARARRQSVAELAE